MATAASELQLANVAPPEETPPPADAHSAAEPAPSDLQTGTEHAAGDAHGAKPGLPQLDVSTFAGQIFWLVITFAALYLVMSRLAVPKIGGVIADRTNKIKGDLDTAAEAKRASEAAIANYEKALADARARGLKIGDEIRRQVQDEANAKSEAAAKQLAADTQKAEAGIAQMRAAGIRNELSEAKRLREEAEALLKQYRAKTANAEQEAQAIVQAAKEASERAAADARAQLAQQIERRGKMAEQKIAQAEAEAIAEVRAVATAVATAASAEVIGKRMTEAKGDDLIDAAIRDLRTKLH